MFNTGEKSLKILDISSLGSSLLSFNHPIKDVRVLGHHIFAILDNKIQKIRLEDFKHISTITYPDIVGFCKVKESNQIIVAEDGSLIEFLYHFGSVKQRYLYTQSIDEYLIAVLNDRVLIYKQEQGLIKSIEIDEFEKLYLPIFKKRGAEDTSEDRELISENIYFSIHNMKLYLMVGERIVGKDLNFYLEDLYALLEDLEGVCISKFVCISNHLILFDDKLGRIFLIEKNCEKILFEAECRNFYYENKENHLIVADGECLKIFSKTCPFSQPFKLIEENIVYQEKEDEFDLSNELDLDLKVEGC